MFQGSQNAPKGAHFQLVESNGGFLNGSTHPDYTDYFEVLPSNKLALGLWLEADRMRALAINAENLDNQREAVKQERRLSFDNQAYATAVVERWPELAFDNWQNSHSLIGSFEDLDAATVEDVARFFKTHYAPNNAVLVISGDIRIPEAKELVETYFGDIPPQPRAEAPDLSEPRAPRPASKPTTIAWPRFPRWPWATPARRGARRITTRWSCSTSCSPAAKARASTRSWSRARSPSSSTRPTWAGRSPVRPTTRTPASTAFTCSTIPPSPATRSWPRWRRKSPKCGTMAWIRANSTAPARTCARAESRSFRAPASRACLLGRFELLDGNPEYINTELNDILAVTAAQIQGAAKQYCDPGKRIVLDILPAGPAAPQEDR